VLGGYHADGDFEGVGYRCEACETPVSLPADVEEVGD
jgi:hypothetical protein